MNSIDSLTKELVDAGLVAEAATIDASRAWDAVAQIASELAKRHKPDSDSRESFTREAFHARRKANIILKSLSEKK